MTGISCGDFKTLFVEPCLLSSRTDSKDDCKLSDGSLNLLSEQFYERVFIIYFLDWNISSKSSIFEGNGYMFCTARRRENCANGKRWMKSNFAQFFQFWAMAKVEDVF